MKDKLTIQLVVACIVTLAGLVLIFCGFWVSPTGEIHNSVLVGFGEALSFAGALFGVDYTYKFRDFKKNNPTQNNNKQ